MELVPLLSTMRWPEVEANLKSNSVAVLPIGSHEQHGEHLPLNTDTATVEAVCHHIARRCDALVLPVIPFGRSAHHMDFPGTISLKSGTLACLISDICGSLTVHGVGEILILNGHGGNEALIIDTMRSMYRQHKGSVSFYYAQCLQLARQLVELDDLSTGHADFREASIILSIAPQTVNLAEARKSRAPAASLGIASAIRRIAFNAVLFESATLNTISDVKEFSEGGSWGSLEQSSAELGHVIIETVASYLVRFISELGSTNGRPQAE